MIRFRKARKRVLIGIIAGGLVVGLLGGLGVLGSSQVGTGGMAYAKINPSGCGIHKDRAKLRLDFFLNPDDPNYDKHHVYVVDEASEEFQQGYKGKVDAEGDPLDPEDYQKWLDSLPHIWQDNPFHSHFIHPDKDATDAEIKAKIEECLNYFYAFHQHCWNEGKEFIEEWKTVPVKEGTVRERFISGNTKDVHEYEVKVQDIVSRYEEFQISNLEVSPQDLNIGEKGTIDVGEINIINRASTTTVTTFTAVEGSNAANDDGAIDTVKAWWSVVIGTADVWFGMFSASGDVLTVRDSESVGNVVSGSEQTYTGLTIDILTGDYIGTYSKTGTAVALEKDGTGGAFVWLFSGECIDPTDSETFAAQATQVYSLYGTGDGVPAVGYSFGVIIG